MKQFVPEWLSSMQLLLRCGSWTRARARCTLRADRDLIPGCATRACHRPVFYIIKVGPLLLAATPTIVATGLPNPIRNLQTEFSSISRTAERRPELTTQPPFVAPGG